MTTTYEVQTKKATDELTDFEKVAKLIGEEFSRTFANIIKRIEDLANAIGGEEIEINGKRLSRASAKDFFQNLGMAELEIDFGSQIPKGQRADFLTPKILLPSGSPEDDHQKEILLPSRGVAMKVTY